MKTFNSFENLLNLLYDTLDNNDAWNPFFEQLNTAVASEMTHYFVFDKAIASLSYSGGANLPPNAELEYLQKYHLIDPRLPSALKTRQDEWFHCHQEFSNEFVATNEFFQDYFLSHGMRYVSAYKILENEQATVIIGFISTEAQGVMSQQVIDFLNRLLPHVGRASQASIQNFIHSAKASVGHALINKLRQPMLLVTSTGGVVHSNQAANAYLANNQLITVIDNKLVLPECYAQQFLKECALLEQHVRLGSFEVTNLNDSQTTKDSTPFNTLQIKHKSKTNVETVYVFFSMLVPQQVMGAFGLRPLIMLFLYNPECNCTIDPALLYAAFGLTPAECRIAALIVEGQTIKEIAKTLGTQQDTVRKQLQSVYQKTATHRQPELMRLLLQLPSSVLI